MKKRQLETQSILKFSSMHTMTEHSQPSIPLHVILHNPLTVTSGPALRRCNPSLDHRRVLMIQRRLPYRYPVDGRRCNSRDRLQDLCLPTRSIHAVTPSSSNTRTTKPLFAKRRWVCTCRIFWHPRNQNSTFPPTSRTGQICCSYLIRRTPLIQHHRTYSTFRKTLVINPRMDLSSVGALAPLTNKALPSSSCRSAIFLWKVSPGEQSFFPRLPEASPFAAIFCFDVWQCTSAV